MNAASVVGALGLAALGGPATQLLGMPWPTVGLLVALGALLSLDDTAWGQTWLGQPLPAGLLAGLVCGDPQAGVAVGLPFQLVTLGNLPVGQSFTGEKVSATIAGVGSAVLASPAPVALAGLGGEARGLTGWLLLGVCLLSLAGNKIVQLERGTHFAWMLEGHRTLWDGRVERFARLQMRCLLTTALRGAVMTAAALLLLAGFWLPLYQQLPDRATRACALLPLLAPPMAVAAVGDLLGWRHSWRWIASGLVAGLLLAWRW